MIATLHRMSLFVLLACLVGCGDDDGGETVDAGRDASTNDASPGEDATTEDATTEDAGGEDAGGEDAGDGEDAGNSDGGDADASADAGDTDGGDTDAAQALTAVATIAQAEGDGNISGTVTFTQVGDDVTVVYDIQNCPDGAHQTHIHGGTGCANRAAQGMHWDGQRGEGIPDIECADGTGSLTYTREGSVAANLRWTIGGSADTNVVGHPVVIHGATNTNARIGCGVIEMN